MNNQIKQLLEKWSASINEKKYRETAQCYEPLTCNALMRQADKPMENEGVYNIETIFIRNTNEIRFEDAKRMIYGLDGKEFSVQEEDKQKDIFVDETTIRAILTERQFKRLTLYVIRGMTVEQIAEQEGVAHQNVSKSIRQAKKKIKFFFEKQGAKVPF